MNKELKVAAKKNNYEAIATGTFTAEELNELAKERAYSAEIVKAILRNENTSLETMEELATTVHQDVRDEIMASENVPENIKEEITRKENEALEALHSYIEKNYSDKEISDEVMREIEEEVTAVARQDGQVSELTLDVKINIHIN